MSVGVDGDIVFVVVMAALEGRTLTWLVIRFLWVPWLLLREGEKRRRKGTKRKNEKERRRKAEKEGEKEQQQTTTDVFVGVTHYRGLWISNSHY